MGVTGSVTGCSLLSALVGRSVYASGAATDKAWCAIKARKSVCKIPARSGKGWIIAGQFYACENSSSGELVGDD